MENHCVRSTGSGTGTLPKVLALLGLLAVSCSAYGQIPTTNSFQGYLTDSSGVEIDGLVHLDLSLHTDPSGGEQVWSETQTSVPVNEGLFSVELGSVTSLDPSDFGVPLFLQIGSEEKSFHSERRS